ncbi:Cu(I)-responsive transcriptional regulator [Thalassolituus hydrocarboniclasticus]|uniref:Cu(I)-responsive transcriptional regulator n=1 Tax=Thalassolituus hydrocarboniclasticus TaxID=2742796 RepID=A0ABY6A460_9GAMM|nr:Cu(I)-responsive transcriptional regulator [Thalassolituus hydrocarboniclasticus]UXD85997.1 Cu(I)-responsive transcriptional regulator [Thalassolituus hydrocarboniclasticus]
MNIGEAAAQAGVSAKMIRHYESSGLLPEVARTAAGYRQYSAQDVEMLRFIRRSRLLGFSLPQIGELLTLWADPQRSAREVKALAGQHLQEVEHKIQELHAMRSTLQDMVAACSGDDQSHCAILDRLAADDAGGSAG